jgi:hypothetical protein
MIGMKAPLPFATYFSLLTVVALLLALAIGGATAVAARASIDVDLSNITHVVNP